MCRRWRGLVGNPPMMPRSRRRTQGRRPKQPWAPREAQSARESSCFFGCRYEPRRASFTSCNASSLGIRPTQMFPHRCATCPLLLCAILLPRLSRPIDASQNKKPLRRLAPRAHLTSQRPKTFLQGMGTLSCGATGCCVRRALQMACSRREQARTSLKAPDTMYDKETAGTSVKLGALALGRTATRARRLQRGCSARQATTSCRHLGLRAHLLRLLDLPGSAASSSLQPARLHCGTPG